MNSLLNCSTFIFLTALLLCSGVRAQDRPRHFYTRQLDNRSGLSSSAVNVVFQDSEELLWAGTWDGLNLYDGTAFRVFNYNQGNDAASIGSNVILDIREDRRGNIWMSTIGGITRLEKPTGRRYTYFYRPGRRNSVTETEYRLTAAADGRLWCSSRSRGLSLFHPASNTFRPVHIPGTGNHIVKIETTPDGRLWILEENGRLSACTVPPGGRAKVAASWPDAAISNFFAVHGRVLAATATGLNLLNENGQLSPLPAITGPVRSITYYRDHYLVAWENQGIAAYHADFTPAAFLQEESRQLAGIRVTALSTHLDRELWVATDGNGLIRISPGLSTFPLINKTTDPQLNKPVRAFCSTGKDLWAATKGQGILIFGKVSSSGRPGKMTGALHTGNGLSDNAVYALHKGRAPYVYIGTDGKGLDIYDLAKKKLLKWAELQGTAQLPAFGSVYAIAEDADSSLWLGTSGSGLIRLRLSAADHGQLRVSSFRQYLPAAGGGPASNIIYALADDGTGRLWMACRYGGLSMLTKKTGVFRTFKATGGQGSLSSNDVLSLLADAQHRLWIGTSYGLNQLDLRTAGQPGPVFRRYTTEEGLPSNTIHALAGTSGGDIWMSTNRGLARLNPETGGIAAFRESDGLQSDEFSDGACWTAPDGTLYFGGIYGFNYFQPGRIRANPDRPNLLVTRLQLGGKSADEHRIQVLKQRQGPVPGYILDRESNFFQLTLKPVSRFSPAKNEFAYRLDGIDKDWNTAGESGNISYTHLPPGEYRLLVRWPDGEGGWNRSLEVLHLQVRQYPWLRYPALAVYALLLAAAGYAFHLYRKNKLQLKYQLEMESRLRKKDEEDHRQRLDFFTNVAHEIQTPLTLIMGSVETELSKNPGNSSGLNRVYQYTARLSYLVQQLMEFRKAEAGYLSAREDYVDLSRMLDNLSALFDRSDQGGRTYTRSIAPGMAGFTDKDKLEKILFNLLSNAFKYTAETAAIKFSAGLHQPGDRLEIRVSNSGNQLQAADLQHIFRKFYTQQEQPAAKSGTGIGLAFARELGHLIGADISASLENDWIHFTVLLPLKTTIEAGKTERVVTSETSSLYGPLVSTGAFPAAAEENKFSLIEELQQRSEHSILLVEDEPELRLMIRKALSGQYIIYEAGSGKAALELLGKTMPSLIISDIMMPDMDGLELCRTVKQTPATAAIPFIILSARGSEASKAEGYEQGADAYIPKPFHFSYLQVRIRKLLEYRAKMASLIKDQHISSQFNETGLPDQDKVFLETLLQVIEQHLDEPELNAALLEEALAISKMQLYRRLKSVTGMTPAEFIRRIRLKHAADMLRNSRYTVSEIFYRTGFNHKSYFFREFKKIYQLAPNEYRQQHHDPVL